MKPADDHPLSSEPWAACFLCHPDPELVFERDDGFFAMLGLGPLGAGYSLIATEEHQPSMLDLSRACVTRLERFTALVRERLATHWPGPIAIGEHGRVAVCATAVVRRYEPLCIHAHRLVFPGTGVIDLQLLAAEVSEFESFGSAYTAARDQVSGPYLYSERSDGSCQLAVAPSSLPRQALRRLVALARGTPELADWKRYPGLNEVAAARTVLGLDFGLEHA